MSVPAEATVTPGKIGRVLRARRWWLVLGIVLGLVAALVFLLVTPTVHRATAVINITAVSADPAPEGRAPSSLLDMSTELQLAGSAITADLAAQSLGGDWTSAALREGIEVTGDAEGTIVRVSYSDTDPQRAVQGADAVAAAYLQVRTLLVGERAAVVGSSLDAQIESARTQLAEALQQGDGADQAHASAAEETSRILLQTLANRRVTLYDVSAVAGQIITPAAQNDVYPSPSKRTVLAAGALAGAFLGLILVLARQGMARRPTGADEIEEELGTRVWTPDGQRGRTRWAAAAEAAAWAVGSDADGAAILADRGVPDCEAAARSLAEITGATIVDLRRPRAGVLRELRGRQKAVLVASSRWDKARYTGQVRDIDSVGCELVGIALAVADSRHSSTAPQHKARRKPGAVPVAGSPVGAPSAPDVQSAPEAPSSSGPDVSAEAGSDPETVIEALTTSAAESGSAPMSFTRMTAGRWRNAEQVASSASPGTPPASSSAAVPSVPSAATAARVASAPTGLPAPTWHSAPAPASALQVPSAETPAPAALSAPEGGSAPETVSPAPRSSPVSASTPVTAATPDTPASSEAGASTGSSPSETEDQDVEVAEP